MEHRVFVGRLRLELEPPLGAKLRGIGAPDLFRSAHGIGHVDPGFLSRDFDSHTRTMQGT